MKLTWRTCLTIALAASVPAAAQTPRVVLVVVRAADGDVALPNAEVIDFDTNLRRFTNEAGLARVVIPGSGAQRLRVRQIGFAYLDTAVTASSPDTVTIHLRRVAFALPRVVTLARRDCPTIAPEAEGLAYWALEAIREGAERYISFRSAYPFRIDFERRSVFKPRPGREPGVTVGREASDAKNWGETYKPGGVVSRTALGFSILNLFLQHLGDPVFWEVHCPQHAKVEGPADARVVRLSFEPSQSSRTSDWGGDVLIDSATSVLQRLEFRLRVVDGDQVAPPRLEGYTTFRYPSPFIAIADSTISMWWRTRLQGSEEWGRPDVAQSLSITRIRYLRATPPKGGGTERPRPTLPASPREDPISTPATRERGKQPSS
jgi:hypothetical protein